jgi:predicted amino acid racemase
MSTLSALADSLEVTFDIHLEIISGGNSANLNWALGDSGGSADGAQKTETREKTKEQRINHLRIGEALLLGCETLHSQAIEGLHLDCITLVAEVIEYKQKPAQPWGTMAENAFGEVLQPILASGDSTSCCDIAQAILALGRQDVDPLGLEPLMPGISVLAASSDHLIVKCDHPLAVGDEVRFGMNYSTLLRAFTSPFVGKVMKDER